MTLKIECVAPTRSQIGEGPVWDNGAQVLWWVDIPAGYIHRYSPATDENETFEFREPVGCLAVREAGGLVLAAKSGFWFFDPETGERVPWKTLAPPDRTGVTAILRLYVTETPEGEAYVYDYIRWLSELYVVEGLR